jgi:hypothetical protein
MNVVKSVPSSPHTLKEIRMKLNVGGIDRILRIVVGLALVVWALMGGPVWAWIGIVPLATGAIGFCPIYPIIGMSTKK